MSKLSAKNVTNPSKNVLKELPIQRTLLKIFLLALTILVVLILFIIFLLLSPKSESRKQIIIKNASTEIPPISIFQDLNFYLGNKPYYLTILDAFDNLSITHVKFPWINLSPETVKFFQERDNSPLDLITSYNHLNSKLQSIMLPDSPKPNYTSLVLKMISKKIELDEKFITLLSWHEHFRSNGFVSIRDFIKNVITESEFKSVYFSLIYLFFKVKSEFYNFIDYSIPSTGKDNPFLQPTLKPQLCNSYTDFVSSVYKDLYNWLLSVKKGEASLDSEVNDYLKDSDFLIRTIFSYEYFYYYFILFSSENFGGTWMADFCVRDIFEIIIRDKEICPEDIGKLGLKAALGEFKKQYLYTSPECEPEDKDTGVFGNFVISSEGMWFEVRKNRKSFELAKIGNDKTGDDAWTKDLFDKVNGTEAAFDDLIRELLYWDSQP